MGYYRVTEKFPFWSQIFTNTAEQYTVGAKQTCVITIQPPSGETWLLFYNGYFDTNDVSSYIALRFLINANPYVVDKIFVYSQYINMHPHLETTFILTNEKYCRIEAFNQDTSNSHYFLHGYGGFKLSERLYSLKRIKENVAILQDEREVTKPVKDKFSSFEDIIVEKLTEDKYGRSVYKPAVVLERDTPSGIDEKANYVVERYTMYCFLDDFEDILNRYKRKELDLEMSGWKKYIKKFEEEGRL